MLVFFTNMYLISMMRKKIPIIYSVHKIVHLNTDNPQATHISQP